MKRFFAALLALALLCVPALAFGRRGETVHGHRRERLSGKRRFFPAWHRAACAWSIYALRWAFPTSIPTHERNADGARAAGLEFGFYHFCTASTTDEAVRQARFFAQTIARYDYGLKRCWSFRPRGP